MSLADRIAARIAQDGPISLADYMTECLLDPAEGYYTTHQPFGQRGDFITAPEVSQMFGELVGLALAQTWLDHGAPDAFSLVELGPGRGTLMTDILRATRKVAGFHDALTLHLIEASPQMRELQARTIPSALVHHDDLSTLPDRPVYAVANEFFDALPIRQFERTPKAWRERVVGLKDEQLALGLSDETLPKMLSDRLNDTKPRDIVEVSDTARHIARELGARISEHGGAALVIDYGDWRSRGDTFQAVAQHAPVDPFAAPGHADLTAHIDFAALAEAARPALSTRMIPQGVWLERLGITARAQVLARNLGGAELDQHIAAHRRLTHDAEMGTLFKAMALHAPGQAAPPGFLHDD